MSGFLNDGLARNYLAGSCVECEKDAAIAIEYSGNQDHVAGFAQASEDTLAPTLEAARYEFSVATQYFEYYGGVTEKIEGKSIPLGPNYTDNTFFEPYGVSAQIVPWSFPVSIAGRSSALSKAAGNSTITKIAGTESDRSGHAERGTGACRGARRHCVGPKWHPLGTGQKAGGEFPGRSGRSTAVDSTGQHIQRSAANNVIPSLMELGGKSTAVALNEANLGTLISSLQSGIYYNAGLVCSAMARGMAHRSIYDVSIERAADLVNGLSVGNSIHRPSGRCPLRSGWRASESQRLHHGSNQSSRSRPLQRSGARRDPGPVSCFTPIETEAEAFTTANGTGYGLVAGIFARNLSGDKQAAGQSGLCQRLYRSWHLDPVRGCGQFGLRA